MTTYYAHQWIYLGTCWYCEKCGEQSNTTAPVQIGCRVPRYQEKSK